MPRSYSFDHFKAHPKAAPARPLQRPNKRRYVEPEVEHAPFHQPVHYGHRFSETQEVVRRKVAKATAPRVSGMLPDTEVLRDTAPIGSLPTDAELQLPLPSMGDLLDDVERSARALVDAARDARAATRRLVRIPGEMAQWAMGSVKQVWNAWS